MDPVPEQWCDLVRHVLGLGSVSLEEVAPAVSLAERADESADQVGESADADMQNARLAFYGEGSYAADGEFHWGPSGSG
jgi:hypothetical protein